MLHFQFHVDGQPVPQGSKSVTRTGLMYEANKAHGKWRELVTTIARNEFAGRTPLEGPVTLAVLFSLECPPSVKKSGRTQPFVKPDLDKLCRSIGDSCEKAGVFKDSQITQLDAVKQYADQPGIDVFIFATPDSAADLWHLRNK